MHTSLKVSLKEIRCPSFSVSTSTPSQSKRRADGRAEEEEDEEAEQVNPLELFLKLVGLVLVLVAISEDDKKVLSWGCWQLKEVFVLDNKIAEEETAAIEREKVFDAIRDSLSLSLWTFFLFGVSESVFAVWYLF